MMEQELQEKFEELTSLSDFKITCVRVYHPNNYGDYFLEDNHIKLYTLDRDGAEFPRRILEREALHELAHHLQINHTNGYKFSVETAHGIVFQEWFTNLLKKYYNNIVPQETVEYLLNEGIIDVDVAINQNLH